MTFGATVRAITKTSRLIPSRAAIHLTPAAVKKVADITTAKGAKVHTICTRDLSDSILLLSRLIFPAPLGLLQSCIKNVTYLPEILQITRL